MKKNIGLIAIILVLVLPIVAINAAPIWETFGMYPWVNFKVTKSGIHIASDPLFDSTVVASIPPGDPGAVDLMKGWVTFKCATDRPDQKNAPKGFGFSVTVKGISAGSYEVMAFPTLAYFAPPPAPGIPSDDMGSGPYSLGTLIVGGDGEGELEGFYDLSAGFYAWRITVESAGTPILETHWIDAADFGVIS
jgi:hypothetical protein